MKAPQAIRIVHTFHAACTALSCHRRRETFQHPRMNKSYAYCWKCLNLNSREADLSLAKHYETLQKDFVVAVNSGPQSWHLKYQVSIASLAVATWMNAYLRCYYTLKLPFPSTPLCEHPKHFQPDQFPHAWKMSELPDPILTVTTPPCIQSSHCPPCIDFIDWVPQKPREKRKF